MQDATAGAPGVSVTAAKHGWKAHYSKPKGVSGKGYYSFTKSGHLVISGAQVTDKRSGKYYACVRLWALDKTGHGPILTLRNPKHHTVGYFGTFTTNFRVAHLRIAKCDMTKTAKKHVHYTGTWYHKF